MSDGMRMSADLLRARALHVLNKLHASYFYLLLAAVLLLSLGIRLAALYHFKDSLYFDYLLWDERLYHYWAKSIADGSYHSSAVYEFAPLPAYLAAGVYKIFGADVLYLRWLNIFLGVATGIWFFLIGREMGGRWVGLGTCLAAALYRPFIFYSIVPLKTMLSVFLFAAAVYFLAAGLRRPQALKTALLGLAIGLAYNVRPNAIVLAVAAPFLLLWVWRGARIDRVVIAVGLTAYVAGLMLAAAPFAIRNYRVAGEKAVATSQGGFHLYMCNNLEYSGAVPFVTTRPSERGIQFTIEASRRQGRKLTAGEASAYWKQQVFRAIVDHPLAFARRWAQKALVVINRVDRGDHYHIGFLSEFVPFFKLPFFQFWIVLPLGLAGMALTCRQSRRLGALGLFICVYAATLVLFFTNLRMRLPLLTVLIPFAVMGIRQFVGWMRTSDHKKMLLYFGLVMLFGVLEFLPVRNATDLTIFYNTHALVLSANGRGDEARRYWEKSDGLDMRFSDFARLSLANLSIRRNQIDRAVAYLKKIPENSVGTAFKYERLGDIYLRQGRPIDAARSYTKSLDVNSGQRSVHKKLIRLYRRSDEVKAEEAIRRYRFINSFYAHANVHRPRP